MAPMSSTEIPSTCTVVVGGDGSTCGQPAVAVFAAPSGTVYAECAEHEMAPAPRAKKQPAAPSVTLTHGAISLRTGSARRYVVVHTPEGDPSRARIEYRTDHLDRAHAHLRSLGASTRLVFDTTTGKLA